VLEIAMTPQAFALVITEAVRDNPHPSIQAVSRERAAELREIWQRAIVTDVLDRLGNLDLRPAVQAVMKPGTIWESPAGGAPEGSRPADPDAAGQASPVIVTDPRARPAEFDAAQGRAAAARHVEAGGDPSQQGLRVTLSHGRLRAEPRVVIPVVGEKAAPEAGQ
jgi:hypothetical protein